VSSSGPGCETRRNRYSEKLYGASIPLLEVIRFCARAETVAWALQTTACRQMKPEFTSPAGPRLGASSKRGQALIPTGGKQGVTSDKTRCFDCSRGASGWVFPDPISRPYVLGCGHPETFLRRSLKRPGEPAGRHSPKFPQHVRGPSGVPRRLPRRATRRGGR